MSRYAIRLEFLSDWHIGTGSSQNTEVDAAIARDLDGFPMVPAKTLTGVLRASAELLATELGTGWTDWVTALFGDQPALDVLERRPRPAEVAVRPALVEGGLRIGLASVDRGLSVVRASTALDRRGIATTGSLRAIEVASAGLVLVSEVDLGRFAGNPTAEAYLAATARLTEHVGGGRRRGLGHVTMQFGTLDDSNEWTAHAVNGWESALPETAPEVPPVAPDATGGRVQLDAATSRDWQRWTLTITARLPLLLADARSGNEWTSHDHVPGSNLLPIVARALTELGVDATSLIASGDLRVGRGHPADSSGGRSWPAPFVFDEEKGVGNSRWTNSLHGASDLKVPRPVRRGWVSSYGSSRPTVGFRFRTHNAIDDDLQRTGEAALYTYRVVSAGQRFVSEVWLRTEVLDLGAAVPSTATLGRSKKDDYGLVDIQVSPMPAANPQPVGVDAITVLCLSDVLLASDTLTVQTDEASLADAVCAALGVTPNGEKTAGLVRAKRIESWSATWGLPRPSLVAIAAGSTIRIPVAEGTVIDSRPTIWIGERHAEGFGEVVVNPALLKQKSLEAPGNDRVATGSGPIVSVPKVSTDAEVAAIVNRQQLHRARRLIEKFVLDSTSLDLPVSSSQIGELITHAKNGATDLPAHLQRNIKDDGAKQELRRLLRSPVSETIPGVRDVFAAKVPDELERELRVALLEMLRTRLARNKVGAAT